MYRKGTLREKYLEKKEGRVNRQLNMQHEEIKDKEEGLEGPGIVRKERPLLQNYAHWRIS